MKILSFTLLIAAIIPACTALETKSASDASPEQKLQHTWAYRESSKNLRIEAKTAYLPGGVMNLAGHVSQNGQIKPVLASGTWHVKDGYLYYTITKSNLPSIIPNGFTSGDKIVRVTDSEFTYISSADGKTVTEHRIR